METHGPGGDGAEADGLKLQDSIDAALNNYEIVKSICSSTSSVKDLLNFRLVNTTFHYEATVRMRIVPATIELLSDEAMAEFLKYLKSPWMDLVSPFTAFKLDLQLQDGSNVMEEFSTAVGPNVRHYIIYRSCCNDDKSLNKPQEAHLMTVLLSHSPQVYSLHLWSDHFLSAEDVALLPFLSELKILKIRYLDLPEDQLPGTTSLVSTLVTLPSPLKRVLIPALERQLRASSEELTLHESLDYHACLPNMDILRLIVQNHTRLPIVSMQEVVMDPFLNVRPETLPDFEELIRMSLTLRDLAIELKIPYWMKAQDQRERNEAIGKNILDTVSELLIQQSASLTHLGVEQRISIGTLALPQLPHLADLNLTIYGSGILPLTPNQFPALRELTLYTSQEGYLETIGQVRLPFLEKVSLFLSEPARFTISWKAIMPNVSHLWLYSTSAEELAIILTQFPQIVDLHVDLERSVANDSKYWDIWTGGAPRPVDTKTLLNAETKIQTLDMVETVQENDGVHRVPSLRNMKALKKLKCSSNGNADQDKVNLLYPILYMTLANSLVPLQELKIKLNTPKKELGDMVAEYEKILSNFHTNVEFSFPYNEDEDADYEEQDSDDLNDEDIGGEEAMNES